MNDRPALDRLDREELERLERRLTQRYAQHCDAGLALDLTRGKPAIPQLDLASALDGVLGGDYRAADGTDTRGYGGLDGLPEAKRLGAELLGVRPDEVVVGGNSSLTLMYLYLMHACDHGVVPGRTPWREIEGGPAFLCPVPGYDRHFGVCEEFGMRMIPVAMTGAGPDMDAVEHLVDSDPAVRGMWCVPKFSNPTGETYSDETVRRVAMLGKRASPDFRVMWDNAYAVHDLGDEPVPVANVMDIARELGTEDSIVHFGSTSKISFAGAGLAFAAGSRANMDAFRKRLGVLTIGPDKVNQLRHVRFFRDLEGVRTHMRRHAEILKPKFDCVARRLEEGLAGRGMGTWTTPRGGYFVSFDANPGLAREIVRLAGEAGVKLTPAGAAFPLGRDPEDRNIRLAPSFPSLDDLDRAMEVFVTCVELASVRQRLTG